MTTQEMQALLEEQSQLIQALAVDPVYNIMTRSGLERLAWPQVAAEATYVVLCDIDNMHALNDRYGWDDVSRMIDNSLHSRLINAERKMDMGRWLSGDEILWIIREGDPVGLAKSILGAMKANGLSATFGIAPVWSPRLEENVRAAADLVHNAKAGGRRGSINQISAVA